MLSKHTSRYKDYKQNIVVHLPRKNGPSVSPFSMSRYFFHIQVLSRCLHIHLVYELTYKCVSIWGIAHDSSRRWKGKHKHKAKNYCKYRWYSSKQEEQPQLTLSCSKAQSKRDQQHEKIKCSLLKSTILRHLLKLFARIMKIILKIVHF